MCFQEYSVDMVASITVKSERGTHRYGLKVRMRSVDTHNQLVMGLTTKCDSILTTLG